MTWGGRKGQQQQSWKDGPNEQYWRGAWAVSPRSQGAQQLPRYDRVQLGGKGSKGKPENLPPWKDPVTQGPASLTTTQAVQRALTTARKADAKIRKLRSEVELRHKQWQKFVVDQKQNYVRQKRQFGEDIAKLELEIQQAATAGEEAAERMKRIVMQGAEAVQQAEASMEVEDDEWERLIREEEEAPVASSFLREAYLAAQSYQSEAALPPGTTAPGLSSIGGHALQAYNQASPACTLTDPYMASPTFGAGEAHQAALSTSGGQSETTNLGGHQPAPPPVTPHRGTTGMPRTPPPSRHPGLPADTGTPLVAPDKAAMATPKTAIPSEQGLPGSGLADRLAAKREERRTALHPFRAPPPLASVDESGGATEEGSTAKRGMTLIADDEDLPDVASPGFKNME